MILRLASRGALAALLAGVAPLAMAQQPESTRPSDDAGRDMIRRLIERQQQPKPPSEAAAQDAARAKSAAPDPLTPPEADGPAPAAPRAEDAKAPEQPAETAQLVIPEPDPLMTQILARLARAGGKADAREDVAGLVALYNAEKGKPIWTSKDGFSPNALKAIREIRNADDWGLDASAFQLPANPSAKASPEVLADAELKLSLAVLKYARHARGGRLDPPSISEVIDRRPHIYDPKTVLHAIAATESPDAYLRGLHPKHEQFKRLRQALLSMNKGGAGASPAGGSASSQARIPDGPTFKAGDNHPQIALVRQRLGAGADSRRDTVFDRSLLEAVNRYQREHGLERTGLIDKKLRFMLNADARPLPSASAPRSGGGPMDEKKLRILVNMERWRWMPDDLGNFYVWDSVPEQMTRVYDRGKVVLMERIVVGKPANPTPTFTANMQFITFHPEWAVPEGIKVNEIAPKLMSGGGGGGDYFFGGGGRGSSSQILQRLGGLHVTYNGREIDPDSVDWANVDIRRFQFIQEAGEKNVLGVVKFRFPNKHDVYMHDTPDRHLFNTSPRTFSHGCMRTENPIHLAEVILAHDKGFSAGQVREMVQAGVTNEIKLSTSIPVHVAYFTAEVDDQGQVHYFPDVYGVDSRVASALSGQQIHFASDPVIAAEHEERQRGRQDMRPQYGYPQNGDGYDQQYRDPRFRPRGRPWNPFEDWN